uniref:Uncharacterized protein n=1 Tax=Cacopsylla melanoneura TaxID=428564 RepID=A0A8D8UU18_9HEMI
MFVKQTKIVSTDLIKAPQANFSKVRSMKCRKHESNINQWLKCLWNDMFYNTFLFACFTPSRYNIIFSEKILRSLWKSFAEHRLRNAGLYNNLITCTMYMFSVNDTYIIIEQLVAYGRPVYSCFLVCVDLFSVIK